MKDLKHIELSNGVLKVGDSVEYWPTQAEAGARSTIVHICNESGEARLRGYPKPFPLNCLRKVY